MLQPMVILRVSNAPVLKSGTGNRLVHLDYIAIIPTENFSIIVARGKALVFKTYALFGQFVYFALWTHDSFQTAGGS